MSAPSSDPLRRIILPAVLLLGDTAVAFAGMSLGYWLRYTSSLRQLGIDVPNAAFSAYFPLLMIGVAFLIASYAHLGLYEERLFLRKFQSVNIVIKGTSFWLMAYLGLSLVLKFQPPISRLFVVLAYFSAIGLMFVWRSLFYAVVSRPPLRGHLQQRVAILGWNEEARMLAEEIKREPAHPYRVCGAIPLPGDPATALALGEYHEIADLLSRESIDVLIATQSDLPRTEIRRLVELCERNYVEWKIVPSSFQIFLTGLRLQTIGRLPVLGVEALNVTKLFNRGLKRTIDIVGAAIGLIVSMPILCVIAVMIKKESPEGPVFFGQRRVGARHRPFTLWKLRSMTPGAEAQDRERQSTTANDPRLLRIGKFIRRWNLDELPQFWNVLQGEMSLVGPRPERPFHVDQLSSVIPHYLPRHLVTPGMTGWAQINGLRGESSIDLRIQYDIYYIENWSLWLDLQILMLTFFRWKNPAA
jgi:exopolysaccharide biosynthesis polyprenyl glycosylphosphotransferase